MCRGAERNQVTRLRESWQHDARGESHSCFVGGCASCGFDDGELLTLRRARNAYAAARTKRRYGDWWPMGLKKPDKSTSEAAKSKRVTDKTLLKFPVLLSYLQDEAYEDGTKRELSALSVFVEQGWVKVALNDKDQRRSCYVSSETLSSVLEALELGLTGDTVDWRSWNANTKKK